MKERDVYVDYAATTPLHPQVKQAMDPYLQGQYANPSSFHTPGRFVKEAVEEARAEVAKRLHAKEDEILFTSGGTEADNLAILGIARQYVTKGKHLITAKTEHSAVLEAIEHLVAKEGFEVTYVPVDAFGQVDPEEVMKAIRPDTILVTLMMANNEIGVIHPIAEIGAKLQAYKKEQKTQTPFFHTDACQAFGYLPVHVDELQVDALSLNGGKIYGPKGIGALYLKRGVKVQPLQFGGSQEYRKRPGTEYVAGIIGLAKAMEIAEDVREKEGKRLRELQEQLITGLKKAIPKIRLNGHEENRLPNNVNISFMDVEGEAVLLYLDAHGIYASTGSACTSATLDPSHVILALGVPYEVAHGSIRFSLGRETTSEDIAYIIEKTPPLIAKLRQISSVCVDEKYF